MVGIFWIGFISFVILSFVIYSIFSNGEEYVEDVEYHRISSKKRTEVKDIPIKSKSKPLVKDKPIKSKSENIKVETKKSKPLVKDKPIKSESENIKVETKKDKPIKSESKPLVKDKPIKSKSKPLVKDKPIKSKSENIKVETKKVKPIREIEETKDSKFEDIEESPIELNVPIETNVEVPYLINTPEDIDLDNIQLEPKEINKTLSSPTKIDRLKDHPIVDEIKDIISDEDIQPDIPEVKDIPKSKDPKSNEPNPKPRNGGLGLMN